MAELPGLQAALGNLYTIERELGRGGAALVFLARDRKHNRLVALKVLRPDVAAALGTKRFLREIETSARLAHPHILSLHDSGEAGGFVYYVMPYVEGESLRDRLTRERQLPVDEALKITRDVADALSYAHSHDVVHRDIKPENILLSGGHAVVADFGIARAINAAADDRMTGTGVAVGTPSYMSPEQASGQPVDGRSDIYALGCVLFEMLAGEPPFTGGTAQAIVARHLLDPPRSLRVVRPSVSVAVQSAIETALAKVPADRFATASQFITALEAARSGREERQRRRLRVTALGLLLTCAVAAVWFGLARAAPLDPNKVVVFPLAEAPTSAGREGMSEDVALMIGSGLEHTDPLRWIDGWTLLDAQQRANLALLTAADERRIARGRAARWYVDGSVVRHGDSTTVVLRLNDVRGDSLVDGASATGAAPRAPQVGLQAVNQLLPHLLAPGRRVDLTVLAQRRPAAVASWLQGEREYRRSNFDAALEYYRRAVAEDSAFALAALRGAEATSWTHQNRSPEATDFARLALAHVTTLSPRQVRFARGLTAYFSGDADSAVTWLTRALGDAPDWIEAHMALGEVYYHLLPSDASPLEGFAEREFRAAASDTGFTPPLYHLAEITIRSGEVARGAQAAERFKQLGADPEMEAELSLMLACARGGRAQVKWEGAISAAPLSALGAARSLAAAGAFPACAEDGFRAVLADRGAVALHWGAFLGLQGILAAEGRVSELRALVDSVVASGVETARFLYLLDAEAGVAVQDQAVATADRYQRELGPPLRGIKPRDRWLIASWRIRQRDTTAADLVRSEIANEARRSGDRQIAAFATALGARLALARGDTTGAVRVLRAIVATGRREALQWDLGEPFPAERLLLAELLFARGQVEAALVVAAAFDQPGPVVFLPYLPASLVLRNRAALATNQPALAKRYRDRLTALGQGSLIAVRP